MMGPPSWEGEGNRIPGPPVAFQSDRMWERSTQGGQSKELHRGAPKAPETPGDRRKLRHCHSDPSRSGDLRGCVCCAGSGGDDAPAPPAPSATTRRSPAIGGFGGGMSFPVETRKPGRGPGGRAGGRGRGTFAKMMARGMLCKARGGWAQNPLAMPTCSQFCTCTS